MVAGESISVSGMGGSRFSLGTDSYVIDGIAHGEISGPSVTFVTFVSFVTFVERVQPITDLHVQIYHK